MASESHNPFRRKPSTTTNPLNNTASPFTPSSSDFARALSSLGSSSAAAIAPPTVTFAKPKPVKKVRVQSPPPSSPESAGAEHPYPKYPLPPRDDDDESSSEDGRNEAQRLNGIEPEDPFLNEAPPLPEGAFAGVPLERLEPALAQAQTQVAGPGPGPPPNPFHKTLQDLEREAAGQAEQAPPAGARTGMDVEAFKRLLLTGQGPAPSPGADTETSSVSRQSMFENAQLPAETPRTSHETEPDDENHAPLTSQPTPAPQRAGSRRKKPPPPPPATRHGKLIKVEPQSQTHKTDIDLAATVSPTSAPSDVNKPLPAPPEEEAAKNILDKEAVETLPELDVDPDAPSALVPSPRPPTPPNVHHSASTPVQSPPVSTLRKPMPPPRRTHGRSESKPAALETNPPTDDGATPPRSSMESTPSRSSSIRRHLAAAAATAAVAPPPAPPPPRRGAGAQHRQSPSVVSSPGTGPSSSSPLLPSSSDAREVGAAKHVSPPAPPPQRSTSLRKNGSGKSAMVPPPPPPPPRARGGSRGSMDGGGRSASGDAAVVSQRGAGTLPEEGVAGELAEGVETPASDDAVRAMLADLDALQREVDAARAMAEGGG